MQVWLKVFKTHTVLLSFKFPTDFSELEGGSFIRFSLSLKNIGDKYILVKFTECILYFSVRRKDKQQVQYTANFQYYNPKYVFFRALTQ